VSDDTKILAFPSKGDIPACAVEIDRTRPAPEFCRHDQIRLVERDRNIVCTKCGVTLEPFNYLLSGAMTIARAWIDYEVMRQRVQELAARVGDLKKEKARLTAAVKRLKEKQPDREGVLTLRPPR
jgi:hypothetical protein